MFYVRCFDNLLLAFTNKFFAFNVAYKYTPGKPHSMICPRNVFFNPLSEHDSIAKAGLKVNYVINTYKLII